MRFVLLTGQHFDRLPLLKDVEFDALIADTAFAPDYLFDATGRGDPPDEEMVRESAEAWSQGRASLF